MTLRFAAALAGVAAFAAAAASAAGCSSGSGPLVTSTSGGREDPGTTRDPPPPTRDDPAGQCIECDVFYTCTTASSSSGGSGSSSGGGAPMGLSLSSRGGTCTQQVIDAICSGALFGQPACTGGGGGPFTCGKVTCVPQQ